MTRFGRLQPAGRLLRASSADRTGSAMVQFAMILPAFVLLIFGVIEVGRLLWLQNALHYAVEQAAWWITRDDRRVASQSMVSSAASRKRRPVSTLA